MFSSHKHVHVLNTPLNPFYIVKLGYTGMYIFLIFVPKHRLWVLVNRGGSNMYSQSMVWIKNEKISTFFNGKITFIKDEKTIVSLMFEPPHEKTNNLHMQKDADQLREYRAFVFAKRIVHFLFFLNLKFHASSLLLRLYSPICVGPVRKPHCWFSHQTAHIFKQTIRKTCLCNEYPLKPHFDTVKLGFAGVYLFFLFLLQNIDCGYSLEPPCRGGSSIYVLSLKQARSVPTIYVLSKNKKNIKIFQMKIFKFYNFGKICISHGHVFVMSVGIEMHFILFNMNSNVFLFKSCAYNSENVYMSSVMRKLTMWLQNRSDTNRAVQAQ